MRKILAKVDNARLGRAVAGLMDGSIRIIDIQRDEVGVRALLKVHVMISRCTLRASKYIAAA